MKLGESHGFEDCRALPGRVVRNEQRLLAEVCSSSYEFRTKACQKRLQLSFHYEHSVKNEAVMQTGTQSTRESETQAAGRKCPVWKRRVSIALGERSISSYYSILPCVSDPMRFLSFPVCFFPALFIRNMSPEFHSHRSGGPF